MNKSGADLYPTKHLISCYIKELYGYAEQRLIFAIFLAIVGSLLAGFSLVMLIPLLALVGIQNQEEQGSLATVTRDIFDALHFPLNLSSILLLFIFLVSFRAVMSYWQSILLSDIRNGFIKHLKQRLYKVIAHTEWMFHLKNRNADITNTITLDIARVANGTDYIISFLLGNIMLCIYTIIAIQISWKLTGIAFFLAGFLLLILIPQMKKAKNLGHQLTTTARDAQRAIADFLEGIKVSKSFGAEKYYIQRYNGVVEHWNEEIKTYTRSNNLAGMNYQIASAIALCLLFFLGSEWLAIPSAELLVLLLVISRLLPQISSLHSNFQQAALMLPAYGNVKATEERYSRHSEPRDKKPFPFTLDKSIELRNVSFGFDKSDGIILKHINLTIPAKQTIAIIGESGAGKSTLTDLLSGLLTPDSGEIYIDNHPLTKDNHISWRKNISYVSQETFLFHDTIRNNIQWLESNVSDDRLWHFLKLSAADKFVAKLPDGIDTVVGERGNRLSGGERQRIALARALMRNPKLMILDEATSALDEKNEAFIHQSIDELHGKLTIVFITHRHSTLRFADQVFEIKNKKLVPLVETSK